MRVDADAEADGSSPTLFIGQDAAGHWLVQESTGNFGGRFVSREAAMSFARAERYRFEGDHVVLAAFPLTPAISFEPVADGERAFRRAA
jgi:hypothetical protein